MKAITSMNRSNRHVDCLALTLVGLVALGSTSRANTHDAPPKFGIVHIEPSSSIGLSATALNNASQVTGTVLHQVNGQTRAFPFVWSASAGLRELQPPAGHTGASASDINNSGQVVGFLTHPSFGLRGYRWSTLSVAPYQLFPALSNRLPLAISDNGRTVAGMGYDGQSPAWVFDIVTNEVTDLLVGELVEGVNQAVSVNASGVVVGTISTRLSNGNVRPHAFRYTPGVAGWFIELLPGPRGTWHWTDANAINVHGDIVGHVFDDIDQSAAFWDITANFTDLGLASPSEFVTIAKSINKAGWIVGWSPNDHPAGLDTPFLWFKGNFYDLNDLVVGLGLGTSDAAAGPAPVVYRAHDVNDKGVILVELLHSYPTSRLESVLLVPR